MAESPFPVHGATRKMERVGEGGEGIDYWSLCQANAISRIDAIHASRGCKHRSTVNDEFFAGFSRPERDENSLSLSPEYLSTEQYGVQLRSHPPLILLHILRRV